MNLNFLLGPIFEELCGFMNAIYKHADRDIFAYHGDKFQSWTSGAVTPYFAFVFRYKTVKA